MMEADTKRKTMMAGVGAGALIGLVAAVLLIRRAEKQESSVAITTGESFRLGMLVIGLLRSIADLAD